MRITPRHRRAALFVSGGLLVLSLVLLAGRQERRPPVTEVALSDFLTAANTGALRQVDIEPDRFVGLKADGSRVQTGAPLGYAAAHPTFVPDLIARGIRVEVRAGSTGAMFSASALVVTLAFFGAAGLCPLSPQPRPHALGRTGRAPRRQGRHVGDLRRCGRRGRGQGRTQGDRRVPARARPFRRHRRPNSQRRAAGRLARHGQDAARALDCRRSRSAVPLCQRVGLRRDVCRRRRQPRAQAVQGSAQAPGQHHLHRRARRRRPQPRQPVAEPRGARADAESAARRDGRLRAEPGPGRHRRDQPARHPRQGPVAAGSVRPAGHGGQPGRPRPRGDPRDSLAQGADGPGRGPACRRAGHARVLRRGSGEPGERGGAAGRARGPRRHRRQRPGAGTRQGADGRRAQVAGDDRRRAQDHGVPRGRVMRSSRRSCRTPIRFTRSRLSRAAARWA